MKRMILSAVVLYGLLLSSVGLAGPPGLYIITSTDFGNIPDGITTSPTSYGRPLDMGFDASGIPGTVSEVVVSFSITHSYVGDLRVSLIAPNGKTHLLFNRSGSTSTSPFGYSSDLNGQYSFSDTAADNWWTLAQTNPVPNITARTVVSGGAGVTYPPAQTSLNSRFTSTAANGRWILRFEDGALGDTGSVFGASLQLTVVGTAHVVTHAGDSGAGSLRSALTAANPGDKITFDAGFFSTPQTINLLTKLPDIDKVLAIVGPGADLLTVRRDDSAPDFEVIVIEGGGGVSLSGMTVSNGRSFFGGGINSSSDLTLSGMNLTGNQAIFGGGLRLSAAGGDIINSTFSGNHSSFGAGIFAVDLSNTLKLINSTVSGNFASRDFGGILVKTSDVLSFTVEIHSSTITDNIGHGITVEYEYINGLGNVNVDIRNSIVANNLRGNFRTQFVIFDGATITSQGFNLSNDYGDAITPIYEDVTGDPRLGPLALQGGTTPTHLLLPGSAALDAGKSSGAALDQRGVPRIFDIAAIGNTFGGDGADIGAVEMQPIMVTNADDDGAGSLRAAINIANAGPEFNDILFDEGFFAADQIIPLASALPALTSMSITGPSAERVTISRASEDLFRIFEVPGFAKVSLTGLAMTDGDMGAGGEGGGIQNFGTLSVTEVVLRSNHANGAGGINNIGSLIVMSSTFSDNSANFDGGALYNVDGFMRVINSTVSGNQAGLSGAAIMNASFADGKTATLEVVSSTFANNNAAEAGGIANATVGPNTQAISALRNSIFSNNSPQSLIAAVFSGGGPSMINSRGFNLASDDSSSFLDQASDRNSANASLEPLSAYGGPTQTHALRAGSDAIDAGSNAGSGILFDQRGAGFMRIIDLAVANAADGDGTDIGAFEAQEPPEQIIFSNSFD